MLEFGQYVLMNGCRHLVRIHSACYQLFSFAFSFDQQKPEDRPSFTALYGELDNLG